MNKLNIVVDFDGTLTTYESGWNGVDVAGDSPVEGALDWLRDMTKDFNVHILSSRSCQDRGIETMINWFHEHGAEDLLDHLYFPSEKPRAVYLSIDARAFQFQGVYPTKATILNFKPWYKD